MTRYVRSVPLDSRRKWKFFNRYFGEIEGHILDLGCSHGNFGQHAPSRVVGTDIDLKALTMARSRSQIVVACDISRAGLPFRDESFSAVSCDSLIEHVGGPLDLMREISRVLKRSGFVVVVTPDIYRVRHRFWRDYTHRHPFCIESLCQLCLDADLDIAVARHHALHYLQWLDNGDPNSHRRRVLGWAEDVMARIAATNIVVVAKRP